MAEAVRRAVADRPPAALGRGGRRAAEHAVRPAPTTLVVENMHCGGCMRKVETALAAVPGVASARANLSARRVTVVRGDRAADPQALIDALARAGFKAAELAGDAPGGDEQTRLEADLLRRLAVAGFATANIMLLSVALWSASPQDMGPAVRSLLHWVSVLIALPAVAYAGQPFFRSAWGALRSLQLNMDVPISLGVLLATAMSVLQTIREREHIYFDAAVMLLLFLLIGRFLDQRMRVRAAGAAENLLGLKATSASVIGPDGRVVRLPSHALQPGMRVLVAAGERVAVDGRITAGESTLDEALITGETVPRRVGPGSAIHAGTVNLGGPLTVEATATEQDTLLAEISRLMEAAEQGRGRYVRLADRAARLYAPVVHVLGASTFSGWMLLGSGWEPALTAAIAVLIITCPCALALAVPAVQVAASSRLFARGILLKAPDGLERLAEVDTIVLDKTGTLTMGVPRLADPDTIDDSTLSAAAALAAASRHPYARAVVRAAQARGLAVAPAAGVTETPGYGLARPAPAGEERLGSAVWCGIPDREDNVASLYWRPADGSAVALRFEDALRSDAAATIAVLRTAGYRVELLSGDREDTVRKAAEAVGIDAWRGQATPADKIARLEALKADGRRVLMVGDGLNDAPALAAAHASLSPSTAADISQTTADAIFQGERLAPVLEALAASRASRRMALQNFAIAIAYNVVFVPLAVAGLATPLVAAVAMSASSIAVTANAVRLRTRKIRLRPLPASPLGTSTRVTS